MKTILVSSLRAAAIVTTLFIIPATFAQAADRAAQTLVTTGSVRVEAAGPYVGVGSYRIQVSVKLGRPSITLPDGTWLYENFTVDDSAAAGTLVVRFNAGRVSSLSLASPAVVTALRAQPKKLDDKALIAALTQH